MECFDEWIGKVYFGTVDGRVCVMDVTVDDVKITPPAEGLNGNPIKFSILTTFQNFNEPALFKRGKYIRPQFLSTQEPAVTSKFRYDYDLGEVLNTTNLGQLQGGLWDVGLWDVALWETGVPNGYAEVTGGWGLGRTVAVAMSGETRAETTLINWDVIWDTGAPL